jgi:peptidoglycan/xylan/chitin deacetylase (PgdA/CDA1 family)
MAGVWSAARASLVTALAGACWWLSCAAAPTPEFRIVGSAVRRLDAAPASPARSVDRPRAGAGEAQAEVRAPSPAQSDASPPPELAPASAPQFVNPVVEPEFTRVRVLMYHSFGWFGQQRPSVTPYAFRVQLAWLRDHHVEVVRVSQLLDYLDGQLPLPLRVAVITIDDGERNAYTVAYPLLKEYGFPFALAVPTEAVQQRARRGTLSWENLREMLDSGLCELISHSHTHSNLTLHHDRAVRRELELSRDLLEQHTGARPQAFAYPLGAYSSRIMELARAAGYRAAFVAQGAPVTAATPRFEIPRYAVEQDTNIFAFAYFFRHTEWQGG